MKSILIWVLQAYLTNSSMSRRDETLFISCTGTDFSTSTGMLHTINSWTLASCPLFPPHNGQYRIELKSLRFHGPNLCRPTHCHLCNTPWHSHHLARPVRLGKLCALFSIVFNWTVNLSHTNRNNFEFQYMGRTVISETTSILHQLFSAMEFA